MHSSRIRTRVIVASAAVIAGTLRFTGCRSTIAPVTTGGDPAENIKTVGVAVADQKSLFYVAAVDRMEQAADRKSSRRHS